MISNLIKSADWEAEKHVPVITVTPLPVARSQFPAHFEVEVSVGSGIPHPNTVEHHIAWIALYYVAEGSQRPVELVRAEFRGHGQDILTEPFLRAKVKLPKPGILHAVAYCNLHGLWEGELKF